PPRHHRLEGERVQMLESYTGLLVVGCGESGKMDGLDSANNIAEATGKGLEIILEGSDSFA
ncbi:MAG TPA: stage V sporulation protein AE, partial [Syntrophomonadaceae bacterium]|nr:stage V sporulation protein AE [Syntrophomonadaceae bacterium]HQD91605.1 stage V sporulation protein AE [Syntrophomonadaceae bacterium]